MREALLAVLTAACLTVSVNAQQDAETRLPDTATDLQHAGEVLQARFPQSCGDWEFVKEMPFDGMPLKRGGAGVHFARVFRNKATGVELVAFALCAAPQYAVDVHAPEALLPGGGFNTESTERQSIELKDGSMAVFFTRTYRNEDRTLRMWWAFGGDGKWIAPKIHRIELAKRPTVYKLYVMSDASHISNDESTTACKDFLSSLLPMLDQTPVDDKDASSKDDGTAGGKLIQLRR